MSSSHFSVICISPICLLDMNLNLVYLCLLDMNPNSLFVFVSSHVGMGPHVRKSAKEHDMHIEPKFCKFKLLGKLVVQHSIH